MRTPEELEIQERLEKQKEAINKLMLEYKKLFEQQEAVLNKMKERRNQGA